MSPTAIVEVSTHMPAAIKKNEESCIFALSKAMKLNQPGGEIEEV